MCIHRVTELFDCVRCKRLIKSGKITERVFYTQQRVWQLEQKAKNRCEICGRRKGQCPSKARCARCLNSDIKRKRKKLGRRARVWLPGSVGRPRHIAGGEQNVQRAVEAQKRRMGVAEDQI